jgi:hypothetical protein
MLMLIRRGYSAAGEEGALLVCFGRAVVLEGDCDWRPDDTRRVFFRKLC